MMQKILEYIYYGTTLLQNKVELKKFLRDARDLGVLKDMPDGEIRKLVKQAHATKPTEMVYHQRGQLFASTFAQWFCDDSMYDITVEVDNVPIQAHRLALSAGSTYFQEMLATLPPTTVETTSMSHSRKSFR